MSEPVTVPQERKLILIDNLLRDLILREDTLTDSERARGWRTVTLYKKEYLEILKGDPTHLDTIAGFIWEEKGLND
jgi:hypothetical protein